MSSCYYSRTSGTSAGKSCNAWVRRELLLLLLLLRRRRQRQELTRSW
jgi:hypothetical protein